MSKLTTAEANELRRYLKRKRDQVRFKYEGPSEQDVLDVLSKGSGPYARAAKIRAKVDKMLTEAGFKDRYDRDGVNSSNWTGLPPDAAAELEAVREEGTKQRLAAERKFWDTVNTAYEAALDAITVARIDGNMDAASIIAIFEKALS